MGALLPSLITGLVTGVIALSGVIYTQRQAANREGDRWQREEHRLTGERDWQRELRHASALQDACTEFGAAIVHVRHLSLRIRDEGDDDNDIDNRIRISYEQAWRAFVRIQLLSVSEQVQQDARYAIRHAWGFWQEMKTGTDPRADEYPGKPSGARLNESLRHFYVAARRELGVRDPDAVVPDPLDWDRHPGVTRRGMLPPPSTEASAP
jgi:hypothetical protein